MRVLALGKFDFSRHVLVALANRGVAVHYGYVGTPQFLPNPCPNLNTFPIPRANREQQIAKAIAHTQPDVIFIGTASYDGSNRVALDLIEQRPTVPIIRFYKEFVLKPSATERHILRSVNGLVAGGEREALYFRAVYGLDADRVHIFDPDVISQDLIVRDPLAKLSAHDSRPHVVLGGNLKADDSEFDYRNLLRGLADAGVHVHVYALGFSRWLARGRALDPNSQEVAEAYEPLWCHEYLHREEPVFGPEQMRAWSRYDAGLTQRPPGVFWPELTPVQDMNLPSKYSYYLGAGLPIIVSRAALPSLRRLLAGKDVLVEYDDIAELATILHDLPRMIELSANARRLAPNYTADAGMDALLSFVDGIIRRGDRAWPMSYC